MRIHRALVLAVLVACGPKKGAQQEPPPPPPPDAGAAASGDLSPEKAKIAENAVRLMGELAEAAERAGKDCDRLATDLDEVIDGPNGKAIIVADEELTEQDMVAVGDRFGAELDRIATRFFTAAEPCLTHPGVDAALRRGGLGEEE